MYSVRRRASAGFTLIELLVAIIILGLLATIALPQLPRAQEAARQAEARSMLGQVWQAEQLYRQENATYTINVNELAAAFPPAASPDHWFVYTISNAAAATFTATATRKIGGTGRAPIWTLAYTITVDETGRYRVSAF